MVEIAHEALVRRWPWQEEDREILVWRQRLGVIIQEWQQTGGDDGFLLRGSLLDEARLWLSRRSNDLAPAEKEFINASLSLQHREREPGNLRRFAASGRFSGFGETRKAEKSKIETAEEVYGIPRSR
jgi:hypothetical protein